MRREFPKKVQAQAFLRAHGQCEGRNCGAWLTIGKYHFDHDIPDALGGEPTLENCVVLCIACHRDKTSKRDVPAIAKTKRIRDRHLGIKLRKGRPMAGSKASGLRKRMNGQVEKRA